MLFRSKVLVAEPTPAPLAKIQNLYRYQYMLRAERILPVTATVARVVGAVKRPKDVMVSVDVDPVSLL